MIRFLLAAALLLAGCSKTAETAETGKAAETSKTAETGKAAESAKPAWAPGDPVIRFLSCGPMTCVGGDRLRVGEDGRAVSLRDGELVVVRLSTAELRDLRSELVALLAWREGTIDRTGGASDQPFSVVTVVDSGGGVHETRLEGGPLVEDERIFAAIQRLSALTDRVRTTGELDLTAPIEVTLYQDENTDPVRRVTWPRDVPTPALPTPDRWIVSQVYRGQEAKTLRAALGAAEDNVEVRIGKRTLIASWKAELP
ncbi:hypothetical protein [Streptosporangium sp. NPDC002607]